MMMPVLRFGKFKGSRIDECPAWYLTWLVEQSWLAPDLRDAIDEYLEEQEFNQDLPDEPESTAITSNLVKRWFHRLAVKYHPDREGGSHQAMVAISDAKRLLESMLEECRA